ncbi:MAG: response regulator [Anaerolineae bacterium]
MAEVRIILADDHAIVRAGIRNALQEMDDLVIVAEVGDGPSLFKALSETEADCVLIDVTMPDFDPIPSIEKIRSRYPVMKVLVVSAYDDDFYVQGLLGAGVNGYHLKDQPLSDLRLAVQRVLDGGRWLSGSLIDKLISYGESTVQASALTTRQREILRFLQQGLDNQSIAREAGLSVGTVENHLTRIYRQLNVQSRLEAVRFVIDHPEVLASPGQAAVDGASFPEIPAGEGITLLLVDDNARYRCELRRMIGRVCPHALVYEAENTREAVSLAERVTPQLVFIDVILREENGISCLRRIKAISPQLRVVLISAYPDREFHKLGVDAGAIAFIDKKNLDADTLHQMISDVVL